MWAKDRAMDELKVWRRRIDAIDDQIVDLLAQRFGICREVAAFKHRHEIAVRQPDRIKEVCTRCTTRAEARGVSGEFIARLYDLLIEETCRTEEGLIDHWNGGSGGEQAMP
jgi:chorismate mutase